MDARVDGGDSVMVTSLLASASRAACEHSLDVMLDATKRWIERLIVLDGIENKLWSTQVHLRCRKNDGSVESRMLWIQHVRASIDRVIADV